MGFGGPGLVGYGFWLVKVTFECVLYQMPIDRADRMLDDDDDDRLSVHVSVSVSLFTSFPVALSAIYGAPKSCAMPEIGSFVFSGSFYDLGPICFTSHLTLEPATSARLVSFLTSLFWHKF